MPPVEPGTPVHYVTQSGEHREAVTTAFRGPAHVSINLAGTVIQGVPYSVHPAPFTWHLPEPAPPEPEPAAEPAAEPKPE
jgi:hypothetical protein